MGSKKKKIELSEDEKDFLISNTESLKKDSADFRRLIKQLKISQNSAKLNHKY